VTPAPAGGLRRTVDPWPFVPQAPDSRDRRTAEVFAIQSTGLATRLRNSGLERLVLGLSGGLDSTLALLVALAACRRAGLPPTAITTITMPGAATSDRTKSNAYQLAQAVGVTIEEVPIGAHATELLAAVGHDAAARDVTYENAQARYRTLVLMTRANQLGGLVVGTGDLSELALGWATFSGDHISHYNVNAGVPKTLVRHVVDWAGRQPEFQVAAVVLADILATPVSPELVDAQETEALIGPYELHDFFLYHLVRWRSDPAKIEYLAARAFGERYTPAELRRWLRLFITRFFGAQWKRSVMPDGPKVGSVALSPRGDWRMPSDASAKLWLAALEREARS
jgi:NAD+ synthase (glutamine-hydrolysing)